MRLRCGKHFNFSYETNNLYGPHCTKEWTKKTTYKEVSSCRCQVLVDVEATEVINA